MKTLLKDFIRCGTVGWCLEILFTSLHSLQKRDLRLLGTTSVWMFPIYGLAAFLRPIGSFLHKRSSLLRGSVYAACIFTAEYWTGRFLWKRNCCPWDYGRCKWHVKNIIRLDFLPVWFCAGLLFERVLKPGKNAAGDNG